MVGGLGEQVGAIDRATLTPLVRCALGRGEVDVGEWCCQQITGGTEGTSSIYRASGDALAAGETIPWTLILKVVQAQPGREEDAQGIWYWKREALAYQSGLLKGLPGGLAAPRCYEAAEHPGGAYWLWLEDLRDELGAAWPLEHYRSVARCLGRFNGAYLAGRALPDHPWLSRRWLRQYVENAAPSIPLLLSAMDHPLIHRMFQGITAEFIQQVWDERQAILEAIEGLPQTFCHLDVFPRNVFNRRAADGSEQPVAVDWSFMGIAAVGEEIAPLVAASLAFFAVAPVDATRLEEIVLEGYLAGLQDAGWQGKPDLVRFGYAATLFWRYLIGGCVGEVIPPLLDERSRAAAEEAMGHSVEEMADHSAAQYDFYMHVYEQAMRLRPVLG